MNIDPAQLQALSAILRNGTLEAAAHALSVTPSAISQRLKALEDRMGTALVIRSAPCRATDAGLRLARYADEVSVLNARLSEDLGLTTAPARLRLAVNADSLATWFMPALAKIESTLFELEVDDQDHSTEWLRQGAVSAAVTSRAHPVAGCDSFPLGALRYVATASPEYMRRWFSQGVNAETLTCAPMMTFDSKDSLQMNWLQAVTGTRLLPPTHLLPSTHAFVDAALAGLGWGMNPLPLVKDHINAGRLVALRPDIPHQTELYWQVSRSISRALAPLTTAVRKAAQTELLQTTDTKKAT